MLSARRRTSKQIDAHQRRRRSSFGARCSSCDALFHAISKLVAMHLPACFFSLERSSAPAAALRVAPAAFALARGTVKRGRIASIEEYNTAQ